VDAAAIEALIVGRAPETQNLEFKGATALGSTSQLRSELVKDCTGMANANGGRILYGVAEDEVDGVIVAARLDPVTNVAMNGEWITPVLTSNTGPPLASFDVREVPVAGGRVIVVDVGEGLTAHQSSIDRKYYQRVATTVIPMLDWQVRDVMARRTRPQVEVFLQRPGAEFDLPGTFTLHLLPTIRNVGKVTLLEGQIELEVPTSANPEPSGGDGDGWRAVPEQVELATRQGSRPPRFVRYFGALPPLHPGQEFVFAAAFGMPNITIMVGERTMHLVHAESQPLRWSIYSLNSMPLRGEIPRPDWYPL
jgi:hypothetical protein